MRCVNLNGRSLIVWLSITIAGCGGGKTAVSAGNAAPPGPPTVDVVRVIEQPADVTLSMPGELDPYQVVAIYAKVTGFVKTIRVDRGSRVRAGEVIAVLEAPELTAQRAEAESKLQAAEAQLTAVRSKADADASTYDRLEAAAATPGVVAGNDVLVAQKGLEASRSQVTAGQQSVAAARQALQSVTDIEHYLQVTAPFDGVVTERNVHPGALVGPDSGAGSSAPIVRIVQNRRLRLVVPVPQAYVAGVTPGTVVPFSVSGFPGQTFSGTIARIAQAVDVKTRTMAVELDVANADGRLASGAFCQVQWPVRRPAPSLFVPSGSVASTTDRTFVVRILATQTFQIP
jgi:RND family efflux transporter MFP subunit